MRDSERGVGAGPPPPPPPWKLQKGSLSNTSLDPLKNHKAAKPAFNVGPSSARQRNAFNGVSLVGRWWSAYSQWHWILSPLLPLWTINKNNNKKKSCNTCSWTPSDKAVLVRAWQILVWQISAIISYGEVPCRTLFFNHQRRYFFKFLAFWLSFFLRQCENHI